jgi:hypothetical protein
MDMSRVIIAQTIGATLVVAEMRDAQGLWYAVQDGEQSLVSQHQTKRAAMADWRARTVGPVLHAALHSVRRRNVVHLCDKNTISPYTTTTDAEVTCTRCQRALRDSD